MTTPANAFAKVLRQNQYYMKKLSPGMEIVYDRMIGEVMANIKEFPNHLTQIEQGCFCLGYYHQKKELYTSKEEKEMRDEYAEN